jgi:hypothetical protein
MSGFGGSPHRLSLKGFSITATDVIRLALTRLQEQLGEGDLRAELIDHVLKEVEQYPGRANRGLPKLPKPAP